VTGQTVSLIPDATTNGITFVIAARETRVTARLRAVEHA